MQTENLFNLKIHKLSQEQYDRELIAGTLDEHALYITPDESGGGSIGGGGFSSVQVGGTTISADESEGVLVIGSTDGSITVGVNSSTGGINLTADIPDVPTASTSRAGIVQLSSSTSSTSTTLAATASAVKAAYDKAVAAETAAAPGGYVTAGRKYGTTAGNYSTAEGYNTTASVYAAHAEGEVTTAEGRSSHTEGYSTHATSLAEAAHAEGYDTTVSNVGAHAEGYQTTASDTAAHAEGRNTTASKQEAHAEGNGTTASGTASHSEGSDTTAMGLSAHAEGSNTLAYGDYSHAEGCSDSKLTNINTYIDEDSAYNTLQNFYNVWKQSNQRSYSIAAGEAAHVEGTDTFAGPGGHAEGRKTIAFNCGNHAEGQNSEAFGLCSHAEGSSTTTYGEDSHAEGYNTIAGTLTSYNDPDDTAGTAAHAEGYYTEAKGTASHAGGYYTIANRHQFVTGHYNKESTSVGNASATDKVGDAFIIGNGSSSTRSNAFRVTYAGAAYGLSSYNTSGADYAEYFEWLDGNANKDDRRGYFVTLDGEKIKFAKPGDYILGIISGLPAIIGNSDEDWQGRYLLDEFGAFILEEFESERVVKNKITGKEKTLIETGVRYKENPAYDPEKPYIQRADRPEWDAVGMMGVLSVRDDGTCQVNGYCTVAEGGTATASDSGYRVIKRVNDHIVKVIFR